MWRILSSNGCKVHLQHDLPCSYSYRWIGWRCQGSTSHQSQWSWLIPRTSHQFLWNHTSPPDIIFQADPSLTVSCLNDSYQPSPFFSIIPISVSSVSLWHCILRHTNTSTFQGQGTHCLSKTSPSNTWSALVAPQNVSRYVAMWPKSRVVSLIFDGIYAFPRGKCLKRVVPECSRLIMSQWEVCLLAKLHSGTCHSPWCCRTHSAGSSFLCSSGWGASYPPSQYRKYLPVRPGCKSIQNHSRFFVLDMGWDQVTQGVKIENHWELNIQLLGTRSNHNDFSLVANTYQYPQDPTGTSGRAVAQSITVWMPTNELGKLSCRIILPTKGTWSTQWTASGYMDKMLSL